MSRPLSAFSLQHLALLLALLLPACTSDADRRALQDGFAQYNAHQLDQAYATSDAYIHRNPDASNLDEAYYLRGLAQLSKRGGDRTAAANDFQTAIDKSSRDDLKAKASRALGDIDYDALRFQDALHHYQKALEYLPGGNDSYIYYRTGASLQALGQWDKARPLFERAISLNTDPTLTHLAVARMDLKNFSLQFGAFKDPQKAADLAKQLKATGLNPTTTTDLAGSQLLYQVRAGNYPTYDQARSAQKKSPTTTIVP